MSQTPTERLESTIKTGNAQAAKDIINQGLVKVNDEIDDLGCTALHIAAVTGKTHMVELIQFLLEQGANINLKNKNGDTALHIATRFQNIGIAKFLSKNGADIDAQNKSGDTALHIATRFQNTGIVKFLLKNGANTNIVNNNRKTVLDIARARRFQYIIYILDNTQIFYCLYCVTAFSATVTISHVLDLVRENTFDIANTKHDILLGVACVSALLALAFIAIIITKQTSTFVSNADAQPGTKQNTTGEQHDKI